MSSTSFVATAATSAPSVDGPATARSQHLAPPASPAVPSPYRRLIRGALALLAQAEGTASSPLLPLPDRLKAASEATRHLAQAWRSLTSWASSEGADVGELARAGALLGEINRRLPRLANHLASEATGAVLSLDKEAPASGERRTVPCPPPVPYRQLLAAARSRAVAA